MNDITANTIVLQKKNLPIVEFDGEIALMNTKKGNYYSLDSIGSRIWTIMAEQIAVHEIVSLLLIEYDVSSEICRRDVIELITKLHEEGLIEVIE